MVGRVIDAVANADVRANGLVHAYEQADETITDRISGPRHVDRIGARRILQFALALLAGALVLSALSPNVSVLVMSQLLAGIASGIALPASTQPWRSRNARDRWWNTGDCVDLLPKSAPAGLTFT